MHHYYCLGKNFSCYGDLKIFLHSLLIRLDHVILGFRQWPSWDVMTNLPEELAWSLLEQRLIPSLLCSYNLMTNFLIKSVFKFQLRKEKQIHHQTCTFPITLNKTFYSEE